ncbi:MAG: TlpA family protein disulfide reductase [Deltaproteobacteria bacterium]|nr:TlpA family protein disulfide reductase [Deltaproteobacteria bacterium]MBI3293552.1 TlpA family protein disulfide reductase [Deltaproteobacteria bacterium]
MTNQKASWIGSILIIGLFLALIELPSLTQSHFQSDLKFEQEAADPKILARSLKVIQGPSTWGKATTLGEILKHSPATIVNFWATWCPPCLEEIPTLESLNRMAKGAALPPIVTLSVDESANDVLGLFDTMKSRPNFSVLHDTDGLVARSFGTTKFPETYWINSDGVVIRRWVGPQDWLSADVIGLLKTLSTPSR